MLQSMYVFFKSAKQLYQFSMLFQVFARNIRVLIKYVLCINILIAYYCSSVCSSKEPFVLYSVLSTFYLFQFKRKLKEIFYQHLHIYTNLYARGNTYTHTHAHSQTCPRINTHVLTCSYAYLWWHLQVHARTHAHAHTLTHTHMHTHKTNAHIRFQTDLLSAFPSKKKELVKTVGVNHFWSHILKLVSRISCV